MPHTPLDFKPRQAPSRDEAEMVIVRYASHPVGGNSANDPVTLPAFEALGRRLLASRR